jgi:hypothetical protein
MCRVAFPTLLSLMDWAGLVVPFRCFANVSEDGEILTEGASPVPESVTFWVPEPALSVTVSAPVREPWAVGLNVTDIVQEAPAPSDAPQLLVLWKSPLAEVELIERVAFPLFVSVTALALLVLPTGSPLKLRLVGLRAAPGEIPVPLRLEEEGPFTSSVTVSEPEAEPRLPGWKVTFTVQLAPPAKVPVQLSVPFEKPVPVTETPVTVTEVMGSVFS